MVRNLLVEAYIKDNSEKHLLRIIEDIEGSLENHIETHAGGMK